MDCEVAAILGYMAIFILAGPKEYPSCKGEITQPPMLICYSKPLSTGTYQLLLGSTTCLNT